MSKIIDLLSKKKIVFVNRSVAYWRHVTRSGIYSKITALLQLVVLVALFLCFTLRSQPGVAMAILAVASVMMTVAREKPTKYEGLGWSLLAILALGLEIRSISDERKTHREEIQADRKEQQDSFSRVLRGQQEAFDATVQKLNGIVEKSEQNLKQTSRGVALMMGEGSVPYFVLSLVNASQPQDGAFVSFNLAVDGDNPLRNLGVSFGRSDCRLEPLGSRTRGLSGQLTFVLKEDSYADHGPVGTKSTPQYSLSGTRAVFWGEATSLNGDWNYLAKFRLEQNRWEWRLVTYVRNRDFSVRQMIRDDTSAGFPSSQKRRPILPIEEEDCY